MKHAPPLVRHKIQRRASRLASPETRGDFLGRSESLLAVDDMVGRLVSALRARGELHDTYFIFTSDNGFLLGEHGLVGKVLPYEESIRVPLVIRGPGIDPGSTTDQLVANIDLAPTIAALAGATPGRVEDGESLVPLLRGGRLPPRDLLMELLTGREAFHAIRTDRWMLDHYEDGGSELYDTKRDPYELRNLARSPRYAGIRARLDRRLHALRDCAGSSCR